MKLLGDYKRGVDMKRIWLTILRAMFAVSGVALANGTVTNATVLQLYTQSTLGNVVLIRVDQAPTGAPGCSNNLSSQFVLPLATVPNQQALALLLSARVSGIPVSLIGSGQCDVIGNIETLVSITF